ncbi:hypothetical protein, partial [Sulfitobacter geojensis]
PPALPKCSETRYHERHKTKGKPQKIQAMNTMKLTLGQAAKAAKRAKGTLSKALNNHDISAEKDEKGRWQIDPSELQRWMDSNPLPNSQENQPATLSETPENHNGNSALATEVKLLREQMEKIENMHDREREQLVGQIEDLKTEAERRSREHMQALAVLTDQRDKAPEQPKRSFWARLTG